MKVGELFVALGFDVDNKPLRDFESSLRGVTNDMLRLAGISLSVGGFFSTLNGAAQGAVALDNISQKFNIAADSAQRFVSAAMGANPNMSRDSALAAYQNLANFTGMMQINGAGQAAVFGLTAADSTPEKVIEKVRANFSRVEQMYGRAFAVERVREIMGTDEALNALLLTSERYQSLSAKGLVSEEDNRKLTEYADSVRGLDIELNRLKSTYLSMPAKGITALIKDVNDHGFWYGVKQLGRGLGNAATDLGAWAHERGDFVAKRNAYRDKLIAGGMSKSDAEEKAFQDIKPEDAKSAAASNKPMSAIQYFQSMGWTTEQSKGMVRRLIAESGLNPRAIGDGGLAIGAAQWHPDRQQDLERFLGKPIGQTTLMDQLSFVNHELTRGKERSAGELLKRTRTERDAYSVFTNNYERPAGSSRIEINVNGVTDPAQVAREVQRTMQQTNLGAAY